MVHVKHFEKVDLRSDNHREAYEEAFDAWSQMMDRNGRMSPGAVESASYLEESLQARFGLTEEEAWYISSAALLDRREIYKEV